MANKKIRTREEVKKDLLDKCFTAGVGNKPFKWLCKNMFEMLKPKATIVVDNYVFRLRYCSMFDTPFEEDQPEGVEVRLGRINMDEYELDTAKTDIALNMFLMLNPLNEANGGEKYKLEDKKKDAEQALKTYELVDNAVIAIRDADTEMVKAALHLMTGWDTIDMGTSEVRLELRKYAEISPELVSRAFKDETTVIKYKYFTAKRLGYLATNEDDTTLRWGNTDKVFFSVPAGQDMAERFADYCLSDKGKPVLATLDEKLK